MDKTDKLEALTEKQLQQMEQWAGATIADPQPYEDLMVLAYKTDAYLVQALQEIRRSRASVAAPQCVCGHPKGAHQVFSDHDECTDCVPQEGLPNDGLCCEFRSVSRMKASELICDWRDEWQIPTPEIGQQLDCQDDLIARLSAAFDSLSPSPVAATVDAETGGFTCGCCGRNMELRVGGKFCNECAASRGSALSSSDSSIQATARHYFCSCGGALTAEEYIEHYFEKGHDQGEPQLLIRAAAAEISSTFGLKFQEASLAQVAAIIAKHLGSAAVGEQEDKNSVDKDSY